MARGVGHLARDARVLELELEPVVGDLETRWRRSLEWSVRQHHTQRARVRRGAARLLGGEMTAVRPVVTAVLEGRFREEQVRVAGELRERVGRPAVARVGEHAISSDAKPKCLDVVVVDGYGSDLEARCLERNARLVLE